MRASVVIGLTAGALCTHLFLNSSRCLSLSRNPPFLRLSQRAKPTRSTAVARLRSAAARSAVQGGLSVEPDDYPEIRRDDSVVETLHGVEVADPYRWLEDPDSEETRKFVDDQNKLTAKVLKECDTRDKFKALMTELFDYPRYGVPFKEGDRYFYFHNTGLQNQSALYTQKSITDEGVLFLDPNTFSTDGTVSLGSTSFSENGAYMAYELADGGSDWKTVQVKEVLADGQCKDLADKLTYVKFSCLTWTHDHKGFFYNRYPRPTNAVADLGTETDINENQQLCYHRLGTRQEEDVVVYALPHQPQWMVHADVSDDGRWLLLSITSGCEPANRLYYLDLSLVPKTAGGELDFLAYDFFSGTKKLPIVKLVDDFKASYSYIANEGSKFVFKTNLDAPRYRIVQTDISQRTPQWRDLIAQHEKDVLQSVRALKGDAMVVTWLRDVCGAAQLRRLSDGGVVKDFVLPMVGSIEGLSGDRKSTEFFFSMTGFTTPGAIYRCDVSDADPSPQLFRETKLKNDYDRLDLITQQVFVTSKDGTRVPMFITHHKDVVLDGSNPTLLYGYGGFNVSLKPAFSVSRLCFMLAYRGVYAHANLRGGGEYGIDWRNAGSVGSKQNVFDDFQACAEFLIDNKYCSAGKLTIQGGSNGGLLVAACANQRPDLYACVIGQVGVMDMLRFHKFTIGHAWVSDYGDPDNEQDFHYLLTYSPLHNVAVPEVGRGQYPAVMLTTGDHDDRVVPLHSLKLLATLQHVLVTQQRAHSRQRNPLIARIEVRAGHGAGKPTTKVIDETSDYMAFAAKCMQAPWKLVDQTVISN